MTQTTPDFVGNEIAARTYAGLAGIGLRAAQYPTRGELPTFPALLLHWTSFTRVSRFPEQEWTCEFTGQLIVAAAGRETKTYENEALLNSFVVPLVDLWDPSLNPHNFQLGGSSDGGPVDRCELQDPNGQAAQLGNLFWINNTLFYGGLFTWTADFLRLAGG